MNRVSPSLGVSPAITLAALFLTLAMMMLAMWIMPEKEVWIISTFVPISGMFGLAMRQEYRAIELARTTKEAAAEVKEDNRKNVQEVKDVTQTTAIKQTAELKEDHKKIALQTAAVVGAVKTDKLDTITETLKVVERQTNGDTTRRFQSVERRFEAMEHSLNAFRDEVLKAIREKA